MSDEQLQQPSQQVMTKRDLERMGLEAIDRDRAGLVSVSSSGGGVMFKSAVEVMDFAKLMSVSQQAVPESFRNNPGMCLAVTFDAVAWNMNPFAVCRKAYIVKDMLAYESQLIHAVIEARAPLQERLDCAYDGEGQTRRCRIIGTFFGNVVREYTSPTIAEIKVKNSPLWVADPDQQLFYYACRAWCRRWCPDVLLGTYTKEEVEANEAIRDEPQLPGLGGRLKGSERPKDGFDHSGTHVDTELSQISPNRPGAKIIEANAEPAKTATETPKAAATTGKKQTPAQKRAAANAKAAADRAEARSKATKKAEEKQRAKDAAAKPEPKAPPAPEPVKAGPPKTADEYVTYAKAWIEAEADPDNIEARWDGEGDLRDKLEVPIKVRTEIVNIAMKRVDGLRGAK